MKPALARIPYASCPLCAAEEAQLLGEADCSQHALYRPELPANIRWLRCTSCAHVFTDGYFTPQALALLFAGAHEAQLPGDDAARLATGREVSAQIIERVIQQRGGTLGGRWLDVGFGNGALLTTAAEFGFEVVGLDARHKAVERLRAYGFEAHAGELSEFVSERTFDVISLADVLEHIPFPRAALERVYGLLSAQGTLFVSMPNIDCFLWKSLERSGKNPYWGELEHLHNFSRQGLFSLLESCGFQPCSYGVSLRYVACMEVIARRR